MRRKKENGERTQFLGIEAGATHTRVLLVGVTGHTRAAFELGPANVSLTPDVELERMFREIRKRTGAVSSVAAGLAGVRNYRDRQRVAALARKIWTDIPIHITHDLETAMMAAGPLPENTAARVLLLSGTGSCAYGANREGKTRKFGGRGHILGDQGSACNIALAALRRIAYQNDSTTAFPALGRAVLRTLQLNDPDDLIPWTQEAEKSEIAHLAVTVFQEAGKGDKLAWEIIADAAEKLADMALRCAGHLASPGEASGRVQFVLSGGVLLKQPRFAAQVSRHLHAGWPGCRVLRLRRDSVWGAVEIARLHAGRGVSSSSGPSGRLDPFGQEIVALASLALAPTEQRNPRSMHLDTLPLADSVRLMLEEDRKIPDAVLRASEAIVWTLEKIIAAFRSKGRLFYVGAGTSGRLGILDASECPPTFRVPPEQVQGIIAGGRRAIWSAVEGAEDDYGAGASAAGERGIRGGDVIVGIAASGRTPFVWGALHEAQRCGAVTVLLAFNPQLQVPSEHQPDKMILIDTGPEILTGSTRLKAGTATKLVLNILTTLSMVHSGKVLSNLMVDLHPSNVKLRDRAVRLVRQLTGCGADQAYQALEKSGWRVKKACGSVGSH